MSWTLGVTLAKDAVDDLDGVAESPASTNETQETQVSLAKDFAKDLVKATVRDGYDASISMNGHAEPSDGNGVNSVYISVSEIKPTPANA